MRSIRVNTPSPASGRVRCCSHDVHGRAPAGQTVTVDSGEQALREHLKELVRLEIGSARWQRTHSEGMGSVRQGAHARNRKTLADRSATEKRGVRTAPFAPVHSPVDALTHAEQSLRRVARHDEVVLEALRADDVGRHEVRRVVRLEPGDDGLDKVVAKPEHRADAQVWSKVRPRGSAREEARRRGRSGRRSCRPAEENKRARVVETGGVMVAGCDSARSCSALWVSTHRFSYCIDATRLPKASIEMSRSSRSLYMLHRMRSRCSSVCRSVANPEKPTRILSLTWNTFLKSHALVMLRMPRLRDGGGHSFSKRQCLAHAALTRAGRHAARDVCRSGWHAAAPGATPSVGRDPDAALARHGDHRRAIVL